MQRLRTLEHGTHRPALCCGGLPLAVASDPDPDLEPRRQVKTWSKCLRDHERDVGGFRDVNAGLSAVFFGRIAMIPKGIRRSVLASGTEVAQPWATPVLSSALWFPGGCGSAAVLWRFLVDTLFHGWHLVRFKAL